MHLRKNTTELIVGDLPHDVPVHLLNKQICAYVRSRILLLR